MIVVAPLPCFAVVYAVIDAIPYAFSRGRLSSGGAQQPQPGNARRLAEAPLAVVVNDASTPFSFQYSSSSTPVVVSLSPSVHTPARSVVVVLEVSDVPVDVGATQPTVAFDGRACAVTEYR